MEICECGHDVDAHLTWLNPYDDDWIACKVCGCLEFKERHDPRYDPDDVGDQGYSDEGHPYSGLGKVRR